MKFFKGKKTFMIVASILIMCLASCNVPNGLASSESESDEKEMPIFNTLDEIEQADPECFVYLFYAFYTYEDKWCVSRLDEDYLAVINTVYFDKKNTTVYDVMDIKTDMSTDVYGVVKQLGMPRRSDTFGMISMIFRTDDGAEVSVYFSENKELAEMYVSDVHIYIETIDFTGMKYSDVKQILGSEGRNVGSGVVIMRWELDNKKSLQIWLTNHDSNSLDDAIVSKYIIE